MNGHELFNKIIESANNGLCRDAAGKRLAVTVRVTEWLANQKGMESTEIRGFTNVVSPKCLYIGKTLIPFSQIIEVTRFEFK